jgi:hypothetical protein
MNKCVISEEIMKTMFLTHHEIQELTGYKIPSKQIKWLRDEGFIFKVAGDGRPRVLYSEVLAVMCHSEEDKSAKRRKPHFDQI